MAEKVTVDIVSDVMCPWCVVGLLRLDHALQTLEGEIEATVTWRPFELNPDLGPEGRDWAQGVLEKYGIVVDPDATGEIDEITESYGFPMNYIGPVDAEGNKPNRRSWNTHHAHKLMHWMLETHGNAAQDQLSRALFRAHFQYRRNIYDKATLVAIAAEAGLETDGAMAAMDDPALSQAIYQEESHWRSGGINSVPTFILNGRYALPGAQDAETLADYIRRAAALPVGAE